MHLPEDFWLCSAGFPVPTVVFLPVGSDFQAYDAFSLNSGRTTYDATCRVVLSAVQFPANSPRHDRHTGEADSVGSVAYATWL